MTVLSKVDPATIRPLLAALLALIGLRILWRFSRPVAVRSEEFTDIAHDPDKMPPFDDRGTEVAAAAGGVTNGMIGAWGPVVTPFLMHRGLAPRSRWARSTPPRWRWPRCRRPRSWPPSVEGDSTSRW